MEERAVKDTSARKPGRYNGKSRRISAPRCVQRNRTGIACFTNKLGLPHTAPIFDTNLVLPVAAYLALHHDRATVIALGALLWAVPTFCVGISSTFSQVAIARALTGVGLAIVIPATRSMIADATDDSNRGVAFGWLYLTGNMGSTLGGIISVLLAGTTLLGIPGWRFSFFLVAFISVVVAFMVYGFAIDQRPICFNVATSLGGLFGGRLGDILSTRLPNTGRILLSQISSGLGPPLATILLLALPYSSSTALLHGSVMFIWGFLTSWNSSATNSPILAEIVLEKSRTLTYALDRFFEPIFASFAPPLVGLLAERMYGYVATSERSMEDKAGKTNKQQNAIALGKAIYTSYAIPLAICCMIYTVLYYTYPKDRDEAHTKLSEYSISLEWINKEEIGISPKKDDMETEMMISKDSYVDTKFGVSIENL